MPTNHNIEAIIVPSPEFRAEVVRGGIITPVTKELNIVPATESQRFVPQAPVNGFAPVTVAAVTSAIDSNIQPGNIKEGVSILGVEGNVIELDGETVTITPTTSEQTIVPTSPHNAITAATVNPVTSAIDSNIAASNIKSGVTILGVTGNITELNGESVNITPTTSQQVIEPTSPYNAITRATVSAVTSAIDSNIQAQNIVQGVNILGVEGSYSGITPTGTLPITQNGVYDVTNYANADVQTAVPTYYLEKQLDENGIWVNVPNLPNLNGVKGIGFYGLASAYQNSSYNYGALDLSGLEYLTKDYCMTYTFYNCSGITSVNFSGLRYISGSNCLNYCFCYDSNLVSIDFSSLEYVIGGMTMCHLCEYCDSLVSADFRSLVSVSGMWGMTELFRYSRLFTTIRFDSLKYIIGYEPLAEDFVDTALSVLNLPALKDASGAGRMLNYTDGVTVHLPSNLSGTVTTSTFGGTNVVLMFDLPATNILTGANTVEYERNPKYDTGSALAWRVKDTGTQDVPIINWTPFYTSGTSDPAVSDTIYSDSACTIAETTISSIA